MFRVMIVAVAEWLGLARIFVIPGGGANGVMVSVTAGCRHDVTGVPLLGPF